MPGPGGWCAILSFKGRRRPLGGSEPSTTANAMDLRAAVEGLTALTRPSSAIVFASSRWLETGVRVRLPALKAGGWTENGAPAMHAELWRRLDALLAVHDVGWLWSGSPDGDPESERAAEAARTRMLAATDGIEQGDGR